MIKPTFLSFVILGPSISDHHLRCGGWLNRLRVFAIVGRTGAVVSVADYGPRGPWFETWPRHSLMWP